MGSTAIPVGRGTPTFGQSSAISTESRAQLLPSSVDRKMPGLLGVPVPANITARSIGSMAMLQTTDPFIGFSSSRHFPPPSSLR